MLKLATHKDKITFINGYNLASRLHHVNRWSLEKIQTTVMDKDHSFYFKEGIRTFLRDNSCSPEWWSKGSPDEEV